jgi:hypothetical protein
VLLALHGGAFGIIPVLSPLDAVVPAHYCSKRGAFAIIRGAFTIYIRGAFAIIRSDSSIIRGAFNIIRDHRCFHSTLFPYSFHDMYINDCLNLVCG